MLRTFHAIGQGGFYTEFFSNFTAVYDCGTDNPDKELINREIKATFDEDETIDAIFISHMHEDHVNGLEFLLNHCNVHCLFLPLLNDEEKIQLVLHNSVVSEYNEFVNGLILNPIETLADTGVKVYFTPPVEGGSPVEEFGTVDVDDLFKKEKAGQTLGSNIRITSQNLNRWVFIPFNFQRTKRTEYLRKELEDRNIYVKDIRELQRMLLDPVIKEKITDAYDNIPGTFNTNSQTLYSGPEVGAQFMTVPLCNECPYGQFYPLKIKDAGCIYLGDYEAKGSTKWKELSAKYEKYWDLVGTVQIPHHGSRHNYNREINKRKKVISVISAGSSNRYRHPHSSTVRNIIVDGGYPLIINENSSSVHFLCEQIEPHKRQSTLSGGNPPDISF
jgi:hypothetical protein